MEEYSSDENKGERGENIMKKGTIKVKNRQVESHRDSAETSPGRIDNAIRSIPRKDAAMKPVLAIKCGELFRFGYFPLSLTLCGRNVSVYTSIYRLLASLSTLYVNYLGRKYARENPLETSTFEMRRCAPANAPEKISKNKNTK